jgi:hypothetical protein
MKLQKRGNLDNKLDNTVQLRNLQDFSVALIMLTMGLRKFTQSPCFSYLTNPKDLFVQGRNCFRDSCRIYSS